MRCNSAIGLLANLLFVCLVTNGVRAEDWPQWLGAGRDSVWRQAGVIERIPDDGLDVKWRVPVEWGYAGPAVANGRVYLMDFVRQSGDVTNSAGTRDRLEGVERVLCFDAATGELRWKHEYEQTYNVSYPKGPRCTPTVANGKVYTLGAEGDLHCLDADTGNLIWQKDFVEDYNAQTPQWGFTNHPLVDGGRVYCVVGGSGSVAVAFDAETGEEVWRALTAEEQGYCPPTMIENGDQKQLLIWHKSSINSLNPETGEVQWSNPLSPRFGLATAAPRWIGGRIFASGAGVSALIDASNGETVWSGDNRTAMACSMSTPVVDEGVIYGNDGAGTLVAAKAADGERLWETAEPISERPVRNGTAFLVKNADRLFLFNDSGELVLAALTPEGYNERGRFQVLAPTNYTGSRDVVWSHPAFADKCLFARNDKELVCVSLASE